MRVNLNGWIVVNCKKEVVKFDCQLECQRFINKINSNPDDYRNTPYSMYEVNKNFNV